MVKRTVRFGLVAAVTATMLVGSTGFATAKSSGTMNVVYGQIVTIPVSPGNGYAGAQAASATCPAGQVLTGGGAEVKAGNSYVQRYNLAASRPIGNETWWAYGTNSDTNNPGSLQAFAICAKVTNLDVVHTP
ncbi:hypothetical protein [Streptomyces fuscichromogenes]|uniref:Secreted protein n=1 Tax=Streptomyces fuscichromogenes TaxID=1324013 RepID=A0A918CSP7_9ACTN|nr:hypothetical protein [Streptomyces fuscichromogenes]GGN15666.1 hypothetical protein GCM10011578_043800 [Streptomyces fuscichromogenes]